DRHHDEGDLDEVQEEPQHEHHRHDQDDGAPDSTRHVGEHRVDHFLAAQSAEHEAEERRADQDHEDHGGHVGGTDHHRLQHAVAPDPPEADGDAVGDAEAERGGDQDPD